MGSSKVEQQLREQEREEVCALERSVLGWDQKQGSFKLASVRASQGRGKTEYMAQGDQNNKHTIILKELYGSRPNLI